MDQFFFSGGLHNGYRAKGALLWANSALESRTSLSIIPYIMPVWIFLIIAVWPVVGLVVLSLVNGLLSRRGKPQLPAAVNPGEILARMYLWPIVCWRLWRTLAGNGRHPKE